MKIKSWLSILPVLIPFFSGAQQRIWTFQQCLDTALVKNITVNQTRMTSELNKVSLEQSKASRIPGVSANASEGLNFGRNIDPTTNIYVTEAYHSTSLGVSATFNVFNGHQTANTIRQNRLTVESSVYDIEKARNDVTLNITTGYLQVLFAREILAAAVMQEAATQAQVERTEKMVNAGKSPESDLLQIRSQLATDNLSVINAQNQLEMAKVTLMQLMEIPVSDQFDIEVPVLQEEQPIPSMTNDQLYQRSLEVQPQIASYALKLSASQMALRVSEGSRWPRLTLGANMNTNYASGRTRGIVNPESYPFFEQMYDNIGQSFNLGLSIPIYNQRQIQSNIDRAKINVINARLNEQNTKNVLRKNVEQTFADFKAAGKKYEATKIQLAAVESVYKNAETKFSVGVMNATDFLIQKNNYSQSQSNLIQAKYDFVFKRKILDFYQGKEIKF